MMDIVCEVCGDVGKRQLLVQCSNCKNAAMHLYCFDPVIYDASSFEWFCGDCPPKHNEVPKSLEWNCDHSHKIPRWKGSRNVIEEHNILFDKGFDKAGVRIFSHPENMNDVLGTRRASSFHVPEDSSCDHHYSIQLGSLANEPNLNRIELTNEPLSWGCRRHRSHKVRCTWGCRKHRSQKARRESTDASTKHFLCVDTFNSSEMFDVKKSKCNDILEEAESKNDLLICQPESADGSRHSASDRTVEIQKTGDAVGPNMNKTECLDLSMEKGSCSFSLNCVEGFTQGTKPQLLPLINDVERSYPFVTDSCPTVPNMEQKDDVLENAEHLHPSEMQKDDVLENAEHLHPSEMQKDDVLENAEHLHPSEMVNPNSTSHSPVGPALEIEEQGVESGLFVSVEDVEEQVDGSSPASESWEQPVPLKVVILRPWHDVPNEPASNYSQSGLFASVEYVEQTHPSFTDKSSPLWSNEAQVDGSGPTSESWEQPEPLEVVRPWDDVPNSILRSKPPSNYSQPMQVSDLDVGKLDVLDPSKERMDSWLMPNTVEPSSSSNGRGTSVEKDNTEKTECLLGMNTVTPELNNVQESNPSAEPSSSLNGGASAFGKHSAEMTECLLGMGTLTPALHNVQASFNLSPKTKEVNDANDAEPRCSESVRALENVMVKKRKRLVLSYDADKDSEAMQMELRMCTGHVKCRVPKQRRSVENSEEATSPGNSNNNQHANDDMKARKQRRANKDKKAPLENVMVKKRKQLVLSDDDDEDAKATQMEVTMCTGHVKSRVLKQHRTAEISEEAISPGNSSNQHANDDTKARKQRRANKDKKAPLGRASVPCTRNDATLLASDQQSFICMRPIDKPFWTGLMKIGQEYISLVAHLSNQACKEVQELSLSLPALMNVTKHSKLKAWPGKWKESEPTDECIGLYFFSDNMRELDQLVDYLTDHSLVLKYVVGLAKLLIFPSVFLPEQCQKFQGKHYLWGVFKRRMGTEKQVPQREKRFMGAK